ncbi:MAG: hypothetical protein NTX66_00550 [Candidatus Falkowbacteria bacterium]|nr:hypothetical protein [Candidatus Falkowbacteria bacterium]
MSLFEIIKSTIEYKNIGWNVITLSFLATIPLTMFQIRAAIKQNRIIWKSKSSESWTLTLFAYLCFYFLSFIFYGLNLGSIAFFLSGLPGFFYIPIMIGVWKYKKRSSMDCLASVSLSLIIPLMAFSNSKGLFMLIMFGVGAMAMITQAYKMIRNDNYKDVEPEFLISFLVSSVFWLIYSISTTAWAIVISSSLSLLFLSVMLVLYFRWHKKRLTP